MYLINAYYRPTEEHLQGQNAAVGLDTTYVTRTE